jgi:phage baseplate assembly protein W
MRGMDRTTGKPIDGNAHLAQSVGDILTTPIGQRVMLRDYGSLLFELVDQPLNGATRLLAFAATAMALRRWEPRLRLRRVGLQGSEASLGSAVITIEADRTDLPAPKSRVTLSIPLSTGGAPSALA